jgi:hypothetical protein
MAMASERTREPSPAPAITSIDDPRTITLLTTEHWSLLSARSLAYNEAFVRAGMFLTFLSMSFVALALLAQAMSFGNGFLGIAAVVLAFDLVIGVTTLLRINGANLDDLRANHGMARLRHAYTQMAPIITPYLTTPTHDDLDAVTTVYGPISDSMAGQVLYGLSTSAGMVGLIVSLVAGVLTTVIAMLLGVVGGTALWIGTGGGVLALVAIVIYTWRTVEAERARFPVLFPTPAAEPPTEPADAG